MCPQADDRAATMAIRDGISIELDQERARQEQLARAAARKRKRGGKAQPGAGAESGEAGRRPSAVLAVLAIVFIFVMAAAYAFFGLRQTPAVPSIEIGLEKTDFSLGETVNVTIWLRNPPNGALRDYSIETSQKFQLGIKNQSGGVVAASVPEPVDQKTSFTLKPGDRLEIGAFQWNQTVAAGDGANVTYVRAPTGMYTIQAWFSADSSIWAQRNIILA